MFVASRKEEIKSPKRKKVQQGGSKIEAENPKKYFLNATIFICKLNKNEIEVNMDYK